MANRQLSVLMSVVSEFIGMPGTTGRGAYLAGLAINEAIDEANTRNFWFMFDTANVALTTSAKTYAFPTDFGSFVVAQLLDSAGTSVERDVFYVSQEAYMLARYETSTRTGAPTYLTIDEYDALLRIDTTPGSAYNGRNLRVGYYKKIARISSASATLGIDDSGENMIVQDAIWRARRLNQQEYAADKALAMEAIRHMLAKPRAAGAYGSGL